MLHQGLPQHVQSGPRLSLDPISAFVLLALMLLTLSFPFSSTSCAV